MVLLLLALHISERDILLVGISLEVFADADYASTAIDRSSVSGEAIMCGVAHVCWISIAQKCVTLSTSEAEYVTLDESVNLCCH